MAEYTYRDETFEVDKRDSCAIKVSDGTNTVSITTEAVGYRVHAVGRNWGWNITDVAAAVNKACQELIDSRTRASREDACKELSEFVDRLGDKS